MPEKKKQTNWFTTIFGVLASAPIFLHMMGINVGHVGGGDWLTVVQAGATAALGAAAADAASKAKGAE